MNDVEKNLYISIMAKGIESDVSSRYSHKKQAEAAIKALELSGFTIIPIEPSVRKRTPRNPKTRDGRERLIVSN